MVIKFCFKSKIFISWKMRIVMEKRTSATVITVAINLKARW